VIATALTSMSATDWITLLIGVAAFIGAIWSNITAQRALKLSGRQRVAEFRKEWLEDLRSEVAQFLTHDQSHDAFIRQIEDVKLARKGADNTLRPILDQQAVDLIALKDTEHSSRAAASAKIQLRLNDDKELNGEILDTISSVLAAKNSEEAAKARALLVISSRKLFKSEWDKLSTEMKN
jgi:hypothetical protein